MILLFLEEGIEGKLELRPEKIGFFVNIHSFTAFQTEVNCLNSVYEEAV